MALAPIVLFVYNRPFHTKQALNALAANDLANESSLFIYADGPKRGASAEALENIKKTRDIIKMQKWCGEVFIVERGENYGLEKSVIKGVTEIINKFGKAIILEDDIITSKYFLSYMNDALNVYRNEQKVISIGAFNFFATDNEVSDTFFIPIPDCWGWATWKNRWKLFEPNAQLLLNRLRESGLINKFNLNGAFNFESMLIDQIKGDISSWAIRWQAVAYLEGKLSLYPRYSVTKNIGFGPGGTHGGDDRYSKQIKFADKKIKVEKIPVAQDQAILEKMIKGYWQTTQLTAARKMRLKIRKCIKLLLPPVIAIIYRKIRPHKSAELWQGDFSNWDDVKKECTGYEYPLILEKTKKSILKVKNNEAAGERDSTLFDKVQYSWPLITLLLKIAIENNNQLQVCDFGGSLGSSYFQVRNMIPNEVELIWSVVEQEKYVDAGNSEIKDEHLSFYYSIDDALKKNKASVLLLSSVLQYLETPFEFIDSILQYKFRYIILDRTAFIADSKNRLTIQRVPETIYEASYPAWFFNEDTLKAHFKTRYNIVTDFETVVDSPMLSDDNLRLYWKGFLLKKIHA